MGSHQGRKAQHFSWMCHCVAGVRPRIGMKSRFWLMARPLHTRGMKEPEVFFRLNALSNYVFFFSYGDDWYFRPKGVITINRPLCMLWEPRSVKGTELWLEAWDKWDMSVTRPGIDLATCPVSGARRHSEVKERRLSMTAWNNGLSNFWHDRVLGNIKVEPIEFCNYRYESYESFRQLHSNCEINTI